MAIGNTSKWTGIYGSTPKSDISQIAAADFVKGKPAQIQPVSLTFDALADHASSTYKHYLSVGEEFIAAVTQLRARYKEQYATWNLCCEGVFGSSPDTVQKRIRRIEDKVMLETGHPCPVSTASQNEKALSMVEKAREIDDLKEAQEPEKPHIMTAPERIASNGEVKPLPLKATDNGRPKYLLSAWRELQDAYGRALNRVDEVNRIVPDKAEHDWLIATTKECMRRADRLHERSRNA